MTLTARTDRRLVRAGVHSTRHVLVEVTARRRPVADARTPLNLAFILDRSGSMGGQKIALARQAVERAISALDARDRFSVVVYDDAIDVVVESTTASGEAKRNALRAVARVDARGSTNLADGWLRGAEQVALHQSDDAINRCLLLTDGLANVGETDPETLARHSAELRARGVVTSTFGVGADFEERLLGALADAGRGHFYFIERAIQIPDFITSELGELLAVVAREAALDVQLAPGFRLEPLSTLATEQRQGGCRLALGDLVSGQEVEVVLSLEFPRGELGQTVSVFFTLDDREGALRGEGGCSVTWTYADHAANNTQPRDRDVDRAVARLYAARAEDEALRLNAAGRFDDARRALGGVAERIRGYAGQDEELNELAARLGADQGAYGAPMAPMEMKARYFASANTAHSRDASGRARRR